MNPAQTSQPLDPVVERLVRESFARQGFMKYLGAQLTELRAGFCEIRVSCRAELTQQHGFFHAGVSGTIADSASGYAAFTVMLLNSSRPDDLSVLTVEYKLNLLAPAVGQELVTRATVVRAGKTLTVCRADVFGVNAGVEKLCATSLSTLMALPGRADR